VALDFTGAPNNSKPSAEYKIVSVSLVKSKTGVFNGEYVIVSVSYSISLCSAFIIKSLAIKEKSIIFELSKVS
jgi:hypothetical protein